MTAGKKKSKPGKEATLKIVRRYEPIEFDELMVKLSPVFAVWQRKKITDCSQTSYNTAPTKREAA